MQLRLLQKKWILNFWNILSHNDELHLLTEIVDSIESTEKKAENILTTLKAKFSKSSRVLKAYAHFLEDIKHETVQAQKIFRQAEEIDEDKKSRHKKSKGHVPRIAKSTELIEDNQSDGASSVRFFFLLSSQAN